MDRVVCCAARDIGGNSAYIDTFYPSDRIDDQNLFDRFRTANDCVENGSIRGQNNTYRTRGSTINESIGRELSLIRTKKYDTRGWGGGGRGVERNDRLSRPRSSDTNVGGERKAEGNRANIGWKFRVFVLKYSSRTMGRLEKKRGEEALWRTNWKPGARRV